ncbi:40S ribosomal protein S7-like protein [Cricetulus griseus]|uniref:40S ribosomal protein S7-like protein n=1 Tax=Cricetulus griseus TaxID=10029 RepID=A0A061IFY2_CRIGR|nr:40S ribosomal protein S7-like protein [Cricetulus griseus]
MNPNGKKLDKFESGIFQALLKLQMNSNIKEQLLHYLLESKPKKLEYEVNALFRHMLFSSIFKEFCGYYLQQESLVLRNTP